MDGAVPGNIGKRPQVDGYTPQNPAGISETTLLFTGAIRAHFAFCMASSTESVSSAHQNQWVRELPPECPGF